MQENTLNHSLSIEQRKSVKVTGVTAVNAFSSTQISIELQSTKLIINGSDLKISDFSKENGTFSASGEISGVRYSCGSSRLKLFK